MARGPVLSLGPIRAVSADSPRDADGFPYRNRRQCIEDPGEDPARRPPARDGLRDGPSRSRDLVRLTGLQRRAATPRSALQAPRIFETIRALTMAGALRRPLVVVLEDLHWIDTTSEEYLVQLIDSLPGMPLLLLTTHRPGYNPRWTASPPRSGSISSLDGSERDGVKPPRDDRDAGGARRSGLGEGRGQSTLRRGDRPVDVRARRAAPGPGAGALDGPRTSTSRPASRTS